MGYAGSLTKDGVAVYEPTAVAAPAGGNGSWTKRPAAVAAGRYHTLLLRRGASAISDVDGEESVGKGGGAGGGVYGCGRNASLQLGLPAPAVSVTRPTRICALDRLLEQDRSLKAGNVRRDCVMSVSCGALHSVALTRYGKVLSWGNNSFGQLGVGVLSSVGLSPEAAITSAPGSIVGTSDDKAVWGLPPSAVEIDAERQELEEIASVACGSDHTVFLSVTGQAYAAGCNTYGQLGRAHVAAINNPNAMAAMTGVSPSTPCVALPQLMNPAGPRIRAIFVGSDITLCVPAAGRSALELRTQELQRLLHQSRGHVEILQTAVQNATKKALDVQTAAQIAEQRAAASIKAQTEAEQQLERALAEAGAESAGLSSEKAAALAEVDAQRKSLDEAEEKMRAMKEEHARVLETLEAQRKAMEEDFQRDLDRALEERNQASILVHERKWLQCPLSLLRTCRLSRLLSSLFRFVAFVASVESLRGMGRSKKSSSSSGGVGS